MTHQPTQPTSQIEPELFGVLVHANVPPGKLLRIETASARDAGAIVLTGNRLLDLDPYFGPVVRDQPLLAIDRVRYTGEPIAIVLAEDRETAVTAAKLVTRKPRRYLPKQLAPLREAALVHLTEMLKPGPFGSGFRIDTERNNHVYVARGAVEEEHSGLGAKQNRSVRFDGHLTAEARVDGAKGVVRSSGDNADNAISVMNQLFDGAGLAVEWIAGRGTPGLIPVHVDGLALAAARIARRPVRLEADYAAFNWSRPRVTLTRNSEGAAIIIDAGASVGWLPAWIDELRALVAGHLELSDLECVVNYSEQAPIDETLDGWRAFLGF